MNFQIDASELRPLVQAIVAETVAALGAVDGADGRLAFSEQEAAGKLGVKRGVLRDARLRGEISATLVGGRLAYMPCELRAYLARNRVEGMAR